MTDAVYEAIAYVMRYWFIIIMAVILLAVVVVSVKEFRSRKSVMDRMEDFLGFVEIIASDDDKLLGQKYGICEENTVGSSPDTDICIEDKSIKRSHAVIYSSEGDIFILPSGKASIFINNRMIKEKEKLKTGDIIGIGDIDLRLFIKRKRVGNDY